MTINLVVIGIGQALRGDDSAGLQAVRLWQQTYPQSANQANVYVELAEMPGLGLLSLLEGTQYALLVDAVHSGAQPGTVMLLTEADLAGPDLGSSSAHGWGVAETLSLGRRLTPHQMPDRIELVGIEAGELGMGERLSPQVTAALPGASDLINQCIYRAIS
jgi:hydrogenase maturation protease